MTDLEVIRTAPQVTRAPTVTNALEEFIASEIGHAGAKFKYRFRSNIGMFLVFMKGKPLEPGCFSRYLAHLHATKVGRHNISIRMTMLRRFFKWCWRMGYTTERWFEYIPHTRSVSPVPVRIIRQHEYEKIKAACRDQAQLWAVVCAWNTGMRLGDICTLKWEHVNFENQFICKPINKNLHNTRQLTEIPFLSGSELHMMLVDLRDNPDAHLLVDPSDPTSYICPILANQYRTAPDAIWKGFCRLIERSGVRNVSFKHFRSTFESRLANSGINAALAAKMTGRSDTKSILRYIIVDQDTAREAVANAMEIHNKHSVFR